MHTTEWLHSKLSCVSHRNVCRISLKHWTSYLWCVTSQGPSNSLHHLLERNEKYDNWDFCIWRCILWIIYMLWCKCKPKYGQFLHIWGRDISVSYCGVLPFSREGLALLLPKQLQLLFITLHALNMQIVSERKYLHWTQVWSW